MYTINRFQELIKPASKKNFQPMVDTHKADKHSKKFFCSDLLTAMIYAQLTGKESLRELESGFNAHSNQHYHLSTKPIRRSTLSENLQKKSIAPFVDMAEALMRQCTSRFRREGNAMLQLLDSTPIQLKGRGYEWCEATKAFRTTGLKLHLLIDAENACPLDFSITPTNVSDITAGKDFEIEGGVTYVFDKGYYDFDWWYKIDQEGSGFVTRFKKNCRLEIDEEIAISAANQGKILEDNIVYLNKKDSKYYGKALRRIVVYREDKKPIVLVTNELEEAAEEIAEAYKTRWQIELFFKWIKQNLKIKRFLGQSENAVKLQILTALITYLLLWIMHRNSDATTTMKIFVVSLVSLLFHPFEHERQRERRKRRKEADEKQQKIPF